MKKYLLGILAIALAVGFSAFKAKPVRTDKILFSFDNSNGYSITEVQDPANWDFEKVYDENPLCSQSFKACEIVVDETLTSGSPGYILSGAATITATESAAGTAKPLVQDDVENAFHAAQ